MLLGIAQIQRIQTRLDRLYADRANRCLEQIVELAKHYRPRSKSQRRVRWDQRDIVLIVYGDHVQDENESPLKVLKKFLKERGLDQLISTLHILPFFPYSSDDGFSVVDYRSVNPAFGTWKDVRALGQHFSLMFDLVLNHVSQKSAWFQQYLAGTAPYDRYFIEGQKDDNLSLVTRPRSSPLLTTFDTAQGQRHVWTTFSADQIDLNFCEPDVLVEILHVLMFYLEQGARIIRLDAVAYLWKQLGTSCIHLPQTHEVVKLIRDFLESLAPDAILLTETNVPHVENVQYFGEGDEAHMIYQFSLAPLLIDALLTGDTMPLEQWLTDLEPPPADATYFNFTASHDGIGVRPLEGLLPDPRRHRLLEATYARGGLASTRQASKGIELPYELNISYFSALSPPGKANPREHARRFLASQAVMLALQGIPGIYFNSLFGWPNDLQAVQTTNQARAINRHKFSLKDLLSIFDTSESAQALVYEGYRRLLSTRVAQSAFHPNADQVVCTWREPSILAFLRTNRQAQQTVLVVANLGDAPRKINVSQKTGLSFSRDLLAHQAPTTVPTNLLLQPYQVAWLEASSNS